MAWVRFDVVLDQFGQHCHLVDVFSFVQRCKWNERWVNNVYKEKKTKRVYMDFKVMYIFELWRKKETLVLYLFC